MSFGQAVKVTPIVFPERPSDDEYTELQELTTSQTWTVPEDGWFQIDVVGGSGSGSNAAGGSDTNGGATRYYTIGGNGGGGGAASRSILSFHKGETVPVTISNTLVSFGSYSSADSGGRPTGPYSVDPYGVRSGEPGLGGVARGGNVFNRNGGDGQLGDGGHSDDSYYPTNYTGGKGGIGAQPYLQHGGDGQSKKTSAGAGKAGRVVIFRGNTNIK